MTRTLSELRGIATSATPGPWARDPTESSRCQVIACGNEVVIYHRYHERQVNEQVVPNFKFIAAFNPTVVLALLDAVKALHEVYRLDVNEGLYPRGPAIAYEAIKHLEGAGVVL